MLIPSFIFFLLSILSSLSRRVNANSQQLWNKARVSLKLIKKGEC